ncbi:hypothetical protein [Dongshaea marina]|uniref:hypothetical protein n=1 Tax=Dongshaea marina TaxID=2047966 RepID=UPI00131F1C9F|nr:hypothetical protein [Dongshaea marina]
MAQALGYAYYEKLECRQGRFAQHTMADYVIPTSLDLPRIERNFVENLYPYGPFGAKGGGELTINGGAPAFVAAVEQAVGQSFSAIPLTPEVILEALQ